MKSRTAIQTFYGGCGEPTFGPLPGNLFDNQGKRLRLGYIEHPESHMMGKKMFTYKRELTPDTYWYLGMWGLNKITVTKTEILGNHNYFIHGREKDRFQELLNNPEVPDAVAKVILSSFDTPYLEWLLQTLADDFGKDKLNRGLLSGSTPIFISFFMGNSDAVRMIEETEQRVSKLSGDFFNVKRSGNFTHLVTSQSQWRDEATENRKDAQRSQARETLLKEGVLIPDHILTCFPITTSN